MTERVGRDRARAQPGGRRFEGLSRPAGNCRRGSRRSASSSKEPPTDARLSARDRTGRSSGAHDRRRAGGTGASRRRGADSRAAHCQMASSESFSTPRRLGVLARGIAASQPDADEQVLGPSLKISFKDGQPTQAAQAFAKKVGVPVENWRRSPRPRANTWPPRSPIAAAPRGDVLADALPKEIAALYWPKNMYWRSKNERFVRPVRWLVALLDDERDSPGIVRHHGAGGHARPSHPRQLGRHPARQRLRADAARGQGDCAAAASASSASAKRWTPPPAPFPARAGAKTRNCSTRSSI